MGYGGLRNSSIIMYLRFPSLINSIGASGSVYDSDAQAYFDKGITDTGMKDDWNTFVLSAKVAGYYSKFYYFHPFFVCHPIIL